MSVASRNSVASTRGRRSLERRPRRPLALPRDTTDAENGRRQAGRQAGRGKERARSDQSRENGPKSGGHTHPPRRARRPRPRSPQAQAASGKRERRRGTPSRRSTGHTGRAAPRLSPPRPQAGQARACSSALAPPIHPTNLIIPSSLPPSISHLSHARARRGPRGGLAGRWQVHRALACMWQQLHEHAPHPRPVPHGQKGTPERAEA